MNAEDQDLFGMPVPEGRKPRCGRTRALAVLGASRPARRSLHPARPHVATHAVQWVAECTAHGQQFAFWPSGGKGDRLKPGLHTRLARIFGVRSPAF